MLAGAPRTRASGAGRTLRAAVGAAARNADGAARCPGVAIAGAVAKGPVTAPPLPVAVAPMTQTAPGPAT